MDRLQLLVSVKGHGPLLSLAGPGIQQCSSLGIIDMSMVSEVRSVIKRIAFGNTLLPQEFTLGLPLPQSEITVWLHGSGEPRDVTLPALHGVCRSTNYLHRV